MLFAFLLGNRVELVFFIGVKENLGLWVGDCLSWDDWGGSILAEQHKLGVSEEVMDSCKEQDGQIKDSQEDGVQFDDCLASVLNSDVVVVIS